MRYIFIYLIFTLFELHVAQAQDKKPFEALDVFKLEWVSAPQISHDGGQVVYLRNGMDIMKDRRKRSIWIMKSDGTGHRKLTSFDKNESSPRWSPDDSRLAFSTSTPEGSEIHIHWLATNTTARISQLESSPRHITWSPDGKWLLFSMKVAAKGQKLASMPPKPKGAKWAKPPRTTTRVRHEADGSGYIPRGYYHYFLIPSEGGAPVQLTEGEFQHSSALAWHPDGKSIVFSANRQVDWEYDFRESEIYSLDIRSRQIKINRPQWS